jgi:hypothetical protein
MRAGPEKVNPADTTPKSRAAARRGTDSGRRLRRSRASAKPMPSPRKLPISGRFFV